MSVGHPLLFGHSSASRLPSTVHLLDTPLRDLRLIRFDILGPPTNSGMTLAKIGWRLQIGRLSLDDETREDDKTNNRT